MPWRQITDHAQRSGFRRTKPSYRLTGWPLLDEVRLRCRDLDFTMADLDQMAGTKRLSMPVLERDQTAGLARGV